MKVILVLVVVIICSCFCSAVPQIALQHEENQQYETVFGAISGSLKEIGRDDLEIYEGRREVSFEKDILKNEDTYYFYIIFPREGNFELKVNSVLYKELENLESTNLQKSITIKNIKDSLNKTKMLTIRPGFYYGTSPQLTLTNSGELNIEIEYGGYKENLSVGQTKKILPSVPEGFFYFEINSYKMFSVPIIKLNLSETIIKNESNTTANISINKSKINISVPGEIIFELVIGEGGKRYLNIENISNESCLNIEAKSSMPLITIPSSPSINGLLCRVELDLNPSTIGAYSGLVELYLNSERVASSKINVFVFSINTSVQNFTTNLSGKTCGEQGKFLCLENQECPATEGISYSNGICCPIECKNSNEKPKTKMSSIIIGLIILAFVLSVVYVLYMRSKKIKSTKPEDRFKQIESSYKKKISGN